MPSLMIKDSEQQSILAALGNYPTFAKKLAKPWVIRELNHRTEYGWESLGNSRLYSRFSPPIDRQLHLS